MKFFPKNAKVSNRHRSTRLKLCKPRFKDATGYDGINYRKEFDLLVDEMHTKIPPERRKRLWVFIGSIIMSQTGSQSDPRSRLIQALKQAQENLPND